MALQLNWLLLVHDEEGEELEEVLHRIRFELLCVRLCDAARVHNHIDKLLHFNVGAEVELRGLLHLLVLLVWRLREQQLLGP